MASYKVWQPDWDEVGSRKPVFLWTGGMVLEAKAVEQLDSLARLPFIHKHVAVMPDVHYGMGATVGSVIATKGAIVPAAVGVDIGCGMNAVKLSLKAKDLPDSLASIRSRIEAKVPVGFNEHKEEIHSPTELRLRYIDLFREHPKIRLKESGKPWRQLGTLGGGNHFIELCLDEEDSVWVMLHSGSRNLGKVIADYFITKAKEEMERWFINLPNKDLAYLAEGTKSFTDYIDAVSLAQDYALWNRKAMMSFVFDAIKDEGLDFCIDEEAINCHHNYISLENHFGSNVYVTRKGAVRAREGDLGIIPGSMGAKSFIVRGKGEAQSFNSCSHGAGRKMSRTQASKTFTVKDHIKATEGVECRKDISVLDETPGAYKDIDEVMKAQEDLVDIVHTLKQVMCVKG